MNYWVIICQLINELLSTNEIMSIWYNGDPSTQKLNGRARRMCFCLFLLIFSNSLKHRNKVSGGHDRRSQGGGGWQK